MPPFLSPPERVLGGGQVTFPLQNQAQANCAFSVLKGVGLSVGLLGAEIAGLSKERDDYLKKPLRH